MVFLFLVPVRLEDSFLKSSRRESISEYQISNGNPQKGSFHNFILGIDEMVMFGIMNSIILI